MGKKKRKRRRKEPQRTNEELVALIQQGDDYYMGQLLEQNDAYIRWTMRKLKIRDALNEDDYLQAGRIGLIHSISKYDPSKGTLFLTYATPWIRKELKKLRRKIIKFQREIPLTSFDNENGRASTDWFVKTKDPYGLENQVIHDLRTKVIHKCLDTMGPRERMFAIYRYGFCDRKPMGRESISKYFNIPMREVLRLEKCVKQYVLESLDVDDALEFFGEESIDPAEGAALAREAYENLFSEPAGDYLTNLVDAFQTAWGHHIDAEWS